MVPIRAGRLAVPVVIGIGVAVAACSSAPATAKPAASATSSASATASGSPAGSSPSSTSGGASASAAAVPAGYTRVGGAAQGISIAAPTSWVAINLATQSIQSAANSAGLKGISSAQLVQDMTALQKLHGIIVFDVASAVDGHFARNLNAYCSTSGVTETGAAAVPLVKEEAAAEFAKLDSTNITQRDLEIGGVPGVETSYQVYSATQGTIYGSQLEVLPASDKICFVTVTEGKGESDGDVVSTAAATAQFP
jgi:hypothetical protein